MLKRNIVEMIYKCIDLYSRGTKACILCVYVCVCAFVVVVGVGGGHRAGPLL